MIAIIATLVAKTGREAEFEAAFLQMTDAVKANEPGNRMYQLTRAQDAPRTYKVLEVYSDQAAVDAHRGSNHYKAGGRALRDLVEAPPKIEMLDTVD